MGKYYDPPQRKKSAGKGICPICQSDEHVSLYDADNYEYDCMSCGIRWFDIDEVSYVFWCHSDT